MGYSRKMARARLMLGAASGALLISVSPALAQETSQINLAPQSLASALYEFGRQTGRQVIFSPDLTKAKTSQGVSGNLEEQTAMAQLLAGTGLTFRHEGNTFMIVRADADPQSGSAAGDGAEVEALIVTAQKREEDIQDVPIAISAFTQEQLERSQVAGGPDLMTQVPNMTFTKTNFTSYSIQLRGIGTQAISATVDNAVAVAFNNTPFIRNRFFEQEFYDLQRIEVLRGPQGTLYGRNATAGVVNLISQKPKFGYEAKVAGDLANYNSTRIEGMLNVPLVEDVVALRLAGAWTKREGYASNELSGNPIDGRDLWSTRASLRFTPNDALDVNLIWEHFEENDDRIRSGKQLCKTDLITEFTAVMPDGTVVTVPVTGDTPMPDYGQSNGVGLENWSGPQGTFSQGCKPASLYSPDSFQTPNGASAPYYGPLGAVALPNKPIDPYASRTQSRDLRVIESMVDPQYRAEANVVELQASFDVTDALTVTSETGYSSDFTFSTQDYNRFNSAPSVWSLHPNYVAEGVIDSEGVFCDPQIGCSDRLVAMDLATATSRHFSQELRIGSSFEGPFNFSLGANFLRYDTEDKYYVFINSLSLYSAAQDGNISDLYKPGVTDNSQCLPNGFRAPDVNGSGLLRNCTYIDPNPISSLNDLGHNYFLSRNPYKLISYALFGETYFELTDALKLTAGLRWTVDRKEAPRIPSWVVAGFTVGLPVEEVVEQEWHEPTGRLTIDWKPDLTFTDETMVYASYGHGYKAGGMNPPPAALVCYGGCGDFVEEYKSRQAAKPRSFDPEYIDAFELGAKNILLDGALTLNLAAFYYDYKGYQLSQITDRSAITQNFDATIWGLEIEADWRPLENLKLGFKGGYENTKVADGMRAIDVMDRTAGRKDWVVVSPFPTFPSNCVLPSWLFIRTDQAQPSLVGLGGQSGGSAGACELAYVFRVDPVTGFPYQENPTQTRYTGGPPGGSSLEIRPGYPGWDPTADYGANLGEGFFKDLSGNELPNAPDFTATITADYTIPLPNDWLATLHTDLYMQSEAWTRIFNMEGYDKLKAYTNVNLAAIFTQEELGWKVMAYVKNVFDRDSITGAFLNSDDTGLTTNVFLTEPRLYGLRVTKEWNGGPWWTGANPDHKGPFPLTVELAGQVQRHDAPYEGMQSQAFADLPGPLDTFTDVQNRDLDWGDGRSIRLAYRPAGSAWNVSAGIRYGRTNRDLARLHTDYLEPTQRACAFRTTSAFTNTFCNPASPSYRSDTVNFQGQDWSDTSGRDHEEHTIVDFQVGYDVGLGSLADSKVSAGVRYADFSSSSVAEGDARADFVIGPGWAYTGIFANQFESSLAAERAFTGWGPTLTWDAALPLLGGEESGRLLAEWSVTGGALFGTQETSITGDDEIRLTTGVISTANGTGFPWSTVSTTSFDPARTTSTDVTVPVADVSLGLAYEVGRVKVGAGYRWERYFDVIDGGFAEEQSYDRTIDGPYFKLRVGFGG